MYRWSFESQDLPLKFNWKISRGESHKKKLLFVTVAADNQVGIGEIAGITTAVDQEEKVREQLQYFLSFAPQSLDEIAKMQIPSHLRFGMSSALVHLNARCQNKSLFDFLGTKNITPIATSFSLPILALNEIGSFFEKHQLQRFKALKLKVSRQDPVESCLELSRIYSGPLRIDANEAFLNAEEAFEFIKSIDHLNIELIEQPLPRSLFEEYKKLKSLSPLPLFADESVQDQNLDSSFTEGFHGINVKLMKAGSYQRALHQIDFAKNNGLKVMLGCMVESSLGIAGAMAIGEGVDHFDLDGFLYFENEPHQLIAEKEGNLFFNKSHPLFTQS